MTLGVRSGRPATAASGGSDRPWSAAARLSGRRPRRPVSRRNRWRHTVAARIVSALLAGAAFWLAVSALLPAAPDPGVPALVATHDLALGAVVTAADLRLDHRPAAYAPPGSLTSADPALGQVLGSPVLAGEVVTSARFRGSALLTGLPAGSLAVSLPVADQGLVALLRPADLVSVLVTGSGETIAASAAVLSTTLPTAGVLTGAGDGARLLLALTPAEAKAVAAALGAPSAAGFVVALHR